MIKVSETIITEIKEVPVVSFGAFNACINAFGLNL